MTPDRDRRETVPFEVPLAAVDRKIAQAKEEIRKELIANLDRQVLERAYDKAKLAIAEAKEAAQEAKAAAAATMAAQQTSLRRYHKLITAHVVMFVMLVALAGVLGMGWAYASTNRERIDDLERRQEQR